MYRRAPVLVCLLLVLSLVLPLAAQTVPARPYHDGSVWNLVFVHTKPGMTTSYLTYLTTDWKREQEAQKKAGYILSYKVISTESHNPTDFDLVLMTEYKDLASMEANASKAEALATQTVGGDDKMVQGYKDRTLIRDIIGERLAREIVLEPKQ